MGVNLTRLSQHVRAGMDGRGAGFLYLLARVDPPAPGGVPAPL